MLGSKKLGLFFYADFMILMIGLGCSDSVRGVFAPVFEKHFSLSAVELSLIITISYLGNLFFMLFGTRLSDAFGLRRVFIGSLCLWLAALALYLLSDNFILLLVGMFFAMGSSTLLNIMLNLMSPFLFAAPGMIINTLFFMQGIGTTFTQSVISSNVESFVDWKYVNLGLLILGAISVVLFALLSSKVEALGKKDKSGGKEEPKVSFIEIFKTKAFWFLFLCFGCYFVGEHGVMNWLNIYLISGQGLSAAQAALCPALFFGGMTLGRLVLSACVEKMGIMKSLLFFFITGTICYVLAFFIGGKAYYLLALAGFLLSIIYPTLMLGIRLYYPNYNAATATGLIMAVATIFDILFNAVFGGIIEALGYSTSMLLLPFFMILSCVIFVIFYQFKSLRLSEKVN